MNIYLAAFVLAFAVVGAYAQVPDHCCFPERWLGAIHQTIRYRRKDAPTYGFRAAYIEYAYDYPNRRVAGRIFNEYPRSYERFVIRYNDDRIYFIGEGFCAYREIRSREFGRICIPDSASYQGNFYMGLNQVTFNRWFIFNEAYEDTFDATSDCIPGFSKQRSEDERYVSHIDQVYANVTTELTDESIFDVPSECNEAPGLSFLDYSDAGVTRLHAYHTVRRFLVETPEPDVQDDEPMHF